MSRTDVCFLSAAHTAFDKRVFAKEAVSLAEAGYRVVHLCPGDEDGDTTVDGVRILSYRRARPGKLGRLLALPTLYRRGRRLRAAAYHCNEPDSWLVGVALKLRDSPRLVFDVHEYYPSSLDRWFSHALLPAGRGALRLSLQLLGLATDRIVLAKQAVANDYSWSRARHVTVLNTVSIRLLPERPAVRAREPGTFRFVHSGLFSRSRGAFVLIQALGGLRSGGIVDVEIVIVGGFNDGSREEWLNDAAKLGVLDQIREVGWLPLKESIAVVSDCDAGLVLFSKASENNVRAMPHKMFDYMLAEIPVIAPNFAPEVVAILEDAGSALLVDTDDVGSVVSAMRTLVEDRDLARELGRRGRDAVLRKYNWEHEAAKLVSTYGDLIGPPMTGRLVISEPADA